jgi:hypothetical protein
VSRCTGADAARAAVAAEWEQVQRGALGQAAASATNAAAPAHPTRLYRAKGCPTCMGTGYKGRIGLHELLVATDAVKELVQARAKVPAILAVALAEGMRTLKMDGIEKVLQGFSIGGKKLAKKGDTITELELIEISVVDRPANGDCRFEIIGKSAKAVGDLIKFPENVSRETLLMFRVKLPWQLPVAQWLDASA